MAENDAGTEKTEQPTSKRRGKARSEGNVPKSNDLNSAVVLIVAVTAVYLTGDSIFKDLSYVMEETIRHSTIVQINLESVKYYFYSGIFFVVKMVLPITFAIAVGSVAVNLGQVGWIFTTKPLGPDFSKLFNFGSAIRKMFIGKETLIQLAKNFAKVSICVWIGYVTIKDHIPDFIALIGMSVEEIYTKACALTLQMAMRLLMLFTTLAIIDMFYTRWKYIEDLKMTKQEVKDEFKDSEGNPEIKRKMMQRQFEIFMHSMMKNTKKADVIITNPIHVAIALEYDPATMRAPKVIAKGLRLIADKIKNIAIENDIPIIENPPLARSIYKKVEVGSEIPDDFFKAVAEILAFVYKLKKEKF